MERGEGMYLWDTQGKKYLDFIGGWAVNCLGHSPAAIVKALKEQSRKLVNASPAFYNEKMIEFASSLTDYSCFDKVFFASSSAEANEGAVKLARKYGSKCLNGAYEVITTINSFRGRTLAMMSATGKKAWENLFLPKMKGFIHVPFNDIQSIYSSISEKTCAVMIEPLQSEGGVFATDEEYIHELRKLCDDRGILLIFDEIQMGIGRTGTLFAYERYGIEPDVLTLAKGIGSGFPLSAMLAKEKLDIFDTSDQGGTYTGQPLAMAVGLAVLEEIINNNLCENAHSLGKYITGRLEEIKEKFNLKDIRGCGLLIAFEFAEGIGIKSRNRRPKRRFAAQFTTAIYNTPDATINCYYRTCRGNAGNFTKDTFQSFKWLGVYFILQ